MASPSVALGVNSRSNSSTHSRVMWSSHVHVMWSTQFRSSVFRKCGFPMPGQVVYPYSDNVLNRVRQSVVHWVGVAADYDASLSAGKAGLVPETSFPWLRWR